MAGERILVVDDGPENREFVVEYVLEPAGYEAITARDGVEAIDMVLKHQPDLILLDLQMPRMNGIQVLKTLSARQMDIPVILMTFHGSEEIAVEVYRLGVRDYIKKPYSVEEMLAAIERSLTETRLKREKEALTERVLQANRELQVRLRELNVLYSVGKSVTGLADLNQLLPRIVDAAIQITQAEEGYLYLLQKNSLLCLASKRVTGARAEAVSQEVNDPVADQVIESRQPIVLTPEQLGSNPNAPLSVACAPLVLRNQVIGVLGVRNVSRNAHTFTKHHSALLSALSDYAAISIENSRNYQALQETKDRENSKIRNTFKRFVPPGVVDQVLDNPSTLQLGGKRREITILFADLRGYSAFSEDAPPEQVIEILNNYLSLAANVILSFGGTLDKYMGDGLMAIFNAPEDQPDHTYRAAEAAVMLQEAVLEMSALRPDGLTFSIGIHVGEAVVGYVGTDTAMNYTAIGDVVNLAKRMQELARPGQILAEEAVINRLGDLAVCRSLGAVKIHGRQRQAFAYELQSLQERSQG